MFGSGGGEGEWGSEAEAVVSSGVLGGEFGVVVLGCDAADFVVLAFEGKERGTSVVSLGARWLSAASGLFDGGVEVVVGHGGEHGVVVGAGEVGADGCAAVVGAVPPLRVDLGDVGGVAAVGSDA